MLLVLSPLGKWGIVVAELRFVASTGQYLERGKRVREELLDEDAPQELRQLVAVCSELTSDFLYLRFANKQVHRREADFWESDDRALRSYIKSMADKRLEKAMSLAEELDIPIHYPITDKGTLYAGDRLQFRREVPVALVMDFHRHDQGTDYRLHLRVGKRIVDNPSAHCLQVLVFTPGLFVLDGEVYALEEGVSAQLLLPFVSKSMVVIPRRIENDYFRKFILKNVAKVEVVAQGFDIDDVAEPPRSRLVVEKSISGQPLLSLRFGYGSLDYPPDGRQVGRVLLREKDDGGFQFIRHLRDAAREREAVVAVEKTGAKLTEEGFFFFSSMGELVEWLRCYGPSLHQQGIEVVQPSDKVYYVGPLSVEQSDEWQGDWLQTRVTIVLEDGRLRVPFTDLRHTILQGEQLFMLPTGELLLIPEEWLKRYGSLLLTGVPHGKVFMRHRSQMVGNTETSDENNIVLPSGEVEVPRLLKAELRPYQKVGYEWLWHNMEARMGCCLSDEMGLGKTLQTIALLLKYKEVAKMPARQPSPGFLFTDEEMSGVVSETAAMPTSKFPFHTSLVVAPASVAHNWRNELARFAPTLSTCVYVDTTFKRREMRQSLMRWEVVITTYRTLVNDIDFLADLQWGVVVFDESQAFKNSLSQVHKAAVRVKGIFHLALSGTPVENHLGELWSLMNVLNPSLLGDIRSFHKTFVYPIAQRWEKERMAVLRQMIAPFFLKRTKEEVLDDLPERQDEVVLCPMTEGQSRRYAEELSRARNEWMDPVKKASQKEFLMMAALQRLRKIANEEGKMEVVFDFLDQLKGTNHKVLLFSEYVSFLERVGAEMDERGWRYDMLTGQTLRREEVIAHFQQTRECQFFLISLKAGGVGLNLTEADYVFILDPWWNQSAEEQAIARSHRIGQRRPVFVYRFVSEHTLEEQILSLQQRKQTLIDSVMPFILLPNTI